MKLNTTWCSCELTAENSFDVGVLTDLEEALKNQKDGDGKPIKFENNQIYICTYY